MEFQPLAPDRGVSPDWAVSPGSILADTLDDLAMTAGDLAIETHLPHTYVVALLCGEAVLGEDAAGRLEGATGVSAGFWLSMEANYRQDIAASRKRSQIPNPNRAQ